VEVAVGELAMPRTRCEVRFTSETPEAAWTERGIDQGELFLSPNPGEDLRPLARIASGGELSRIMLALKILAPTEAAGKTLVFDEVDAGIGGAVADVVGARLQQLGSRYQVLCVTHLPQIAAYGQQHFRIEKDVVEERTLTLIEQVTGLARVEELARMIAGAQVTPAVLATAQGMLDGKLMMSEEKAKHTRARTRLMIKERPRA
jgi:DNA repair protein RecN (Recombination protein N)